MARVKEELLRQEGVKMEYYFKFMDYVYDHLVDTKLTVEELDEMEREDRQSKSLSSKQVGSMPEFPVNNKDYNNYGGVA